MIAKVAVGGRRVEFYCHVPAECQQSCASCGFLIKLHADTIFTRNSPCTLCPSDCPMGIIPRLNTPVRLQRATSSRRGGGWVFHNPNWRGERGSPWKR